MKRSAYLADPPKIASLSHLFAMLFRLITLFATILPKAKDRLDTVQLLQSLMLAFQKLVLSELIKVDCW